MSSPCFAVASPWTNLAAVYRRWAFLRTVGREAEAAAFERDEWESALRTARNDGLDDSDLAALMHAEDERLATATLIADVLAARLPAPAAPHAPASARPSAPSPSVSTPSPASSRPRVQPNDINIADLIDSMLASQRPAPAA